MKILIIGFGSIARKHVDAIRKINSSALIYALRSSKDSIEIDGIISLFNRHEIGSLKLDFVIISSPTSLHERDIEFCLTLGVPLFIEKPISNQLNLEDLIAAVKSTSTYVGCNLRFLECLQFTKQFIANSDSRINEVNSYCGSYLPDWRPDTDYKQGYSADPLRGGGVHLDLIHEIDYLIWIFGYPISNHKLLRSNSSLNIASIDYANYNLIYEKFIANIQLNYFRRDVKRTFEIVFDDFTLNINLLENVVYKNDELIFKSEQTILDTYYSQMDYFIANKDKGMMNDINEAYSILKVVL